jgi:hypothetical protein
MFYSIRILTRRYRSSHTRENTLQSVLGSDALSNPMGVGGNEDNPVSNSCAMSGSDRRVIQNAKGEGS